MKLFISHFCHKLYPAIHVTLAISQITLYRYAIVLAQMHEGYEMKAEFFPESFHPQFVSHVIHNTENVSFFPPPFTMAPAQQGTVLYNVGFLQNPSEQ